MPIVPKYTKQIFVQTPGVQTASSSSARLTQAYENNLTRLGTILPAAASLAADMAGTFTRRNKPSGGKSARPDMMPEYSVNRAAAADASLRLRGGLMEAARNEIKETGTLKTSSLASFAAKNFTPQHADGPAGRDYIVLQSAAREAQRDASSAALDASVQKEETLIRQTGALVRSPAVLEEYLSAQLPAYEARLARAGFGRNEVIGRTQAVRARTVKENILQSLSSGDWRTASAMLEKHGDVLPEELRREFAGKMRASFAQSRGEKLWSEASLKTSGGPEEIRRAAEESLDEPDAQLKTLIREELSLCARRAELDKYRASADALQTLSGLDAASARVFLAGTDMLGGEENGPVRRAVSRLDADGVRTGAELFVRLYFRQNGPENVRAFERKKVSGRDFLRLEAVRLQGLAGAVSPEAELVARAADVWMQKKGFSQEDAFRAQYALLTSKQTPAEAWKEIKNYLEV